VSQPRTQGAGAPTSRSADGLPTSGGRGSNAFIPAPGARGRPSATLAYTAPAVRFDTQADTDAWEARRRRLLEMTPLGRALLARAAAVDAKDAAECRRHFLEMTPAGRAVLAAAAEDAPRRGGSR